MELKKFEEKVYVAGQDIVSEFQGRFVSGVGIKIDGTVDAAGAGAVSGLTLDSPANVVGVIEILRSATVLIRASMVDLFHLDGILHGAYCDKLATTPAAGQDFWNLPIEIPFALGRIPQGLACVDMAGARGVVKGKWGVGTDYASTNVDFLGGIIRPMAHCPAKRPSKGYLRPLWEQFSIDISGGGADIQKTWRIDKDMVCAGVLVRQFNASEVGDAQRDDGLVKNIRMELGGVQSGEFFDMRWGAIKAASAKIAKLAVAEQKSGVAFIPFNDIASPPAACGYRMLRAGSAVTFRLDTSAAVEAEFTAATPAAGDLLYVLPVCYTFENV